MKDGIYVKGAREHNLKSIQVFIPRDQITVVTGVSGSGKSSLVFDTLYAEGQRRYIETLSTYSRYYMDKLKPPDVDSILGLSPVVAMDQKTISHNPRSTIGTVTEVYDYLRLLFAQLGTPICPTHQKILQKTTLQDVYKNIFKHKKNELIRIFAPVIRGKKGFMTKEFQRFIQLGYVKARVDGKMVVLKESLKLEKRKSHHIDILVDQLYIDKKFSSRIQEALKIASEWTSGFIKIELPQKTLQYSLQASCPVCLFSSPELDPKLFSFNSPKGSCPKCNGVGFTEDDEFEEIICSECLGKRLKPEALAVQMKDRSIFELCEMEIEDLEKFLKKLKFSKREKMIAEKILEKIFEYLKVLKKVGVSYLSLNRTTRSLSGGEAQRIRLASQIASELIGVLYIFDEPSIGLHPCDHESLLSLIQTIKKRGNTIVLVEHDESTIRFSDHVIDIGPFAGHLGGKLIFQGGLSSLMKNKKSLTGRYLSQNLKIAVPPKRRKGGAVFGIIGAKGNNLKNVSLRIKSSTLTCVTGVSGSGKSSLIVDTLHKVFCEYEKNSLPYKKVVGSELIDKTILVNQKPIGRTSRSVPATYVGVMSLIRTFMSLLPTAQVRGYSPSYFSFNVKGGRCESCEGAGQIKQEMHFLSDAVIPCEMCQSQRYSSDILNIKYKGKNISDILKMTVKEALVFFENHPLIQVQLKNLSDVGLSYLTLGQSSSSLSGGEAQRIKLTKELSKKQTKKTLYILDEPTTGLHFDDIHKLLKVLNHLVDLGNTVVVIEHNMDVIKSSDDVIDMGPEGGKKGGKIVAQGTPEKLANSSSSVTGKYLKSVLKKSR